MIRKVERTVTETGTTIDQDVELSQKGKFIVVPTTSGANVLLAIPCNIPNPETLNLYPLTANSARALGASDGEAPAYTDFVLHWATGATQTYASVASNSNIDEINHRLRMDTASYSLFVATASQTSGNVGSNALLASNSLWRKVDGYANNPRKYLLVNIANIASTIYQTKKMWFKYEIRGY